MEDKKRYLKDTAKNTHDKIYPCGNRSWNDCYTIHDNRLLFWFNTEDQTTRVVATTLED